METTKMALICPLGMTGPVVTETIDALIQKWIGIQPCYTPQQAWPIKNDQIQLLPEFSLDIYCPYTIGAIRYGAIAFPDPGRPQPDENAHLPKYFKRYERHPAQKCVEAVHYLEGYKLAIADQAESVDNTWKKSHKPKVITLDNVRLVGIPVQSWKDSTPGKLLEDVRGPDDNRCFQNLLYGLHHCLQDIYPTILMSLAGGRKSMSAYGMVSAMMFGKPDTVMERHLPLLSHVLVNDQALEKSDMYQLPYGAYDLAEVPFFPMTDLVGQVLREMNVTFPVEFSNGRKYTDRFPEPDFFHKLKDPGLRDFLYRIGSIYTEKLSEIFVGIGKLIQQGIIFRAIKHDVIDSLKVSSDPVAKHCYTQINAISNFDAKLDNRKMKVDSLKNMIESAFNSYIDQNHPAVEYTTEICVSDSLQVQVNPDFIQLVFFNLIKNSFDAFYRFWDQNEGNEEPVLKLQFSVLEVPERITLEYRDNAGGIPGEHISRIFDFGYSTGSASSRGFGLFMCRKIMESHGGTIVYNTEGANGGACFILSFPK